MEKGCVGISCILSSLSITISLRLVWAGEDLNAETRRARRNAEKSVGLSQGDHSHAKPPRTQRGREKARNHLSHHRSYWGMVFMFTTDELRWTLMHASGESLFSRFLVFFVAERGVRPENSRRGLMLGGSTEGSTCWERGFERRGAEIAEERGEERQSSVMGAFSREVAKNAKGKPLMRRDY